MSQEQKSCFQLSQLDAVQWLRSLESESIDLIVTDPPYESLEKHRAIGTTTRLKKSKASSNDWFSIFPNSRFSELFQEFYRVLKRNTHLYMYCDAETSYVAKPIGEAAGFKFWKPLVWDKKTMGMGYHYRARYEFILFFEKGKKKLNNLGIADILEAPRIHNGYPTEKPSKISEILINQSTQMGELVIDPFMGSASVGVASVTNKRRFYGNDTCAEAIDIARQRLLASGGEEKIRAVSTNSLSENDKLAAKSSPDATQQLALSKNEKLAVKSSPDATQQLSMLLDGSRK